MTASKFVRAGSKVIANGEKIFGKATTNCD
jgi:hypothetical protein